jgi:hypothetical protein
MLSKKNRILAEELFKSIDFNCQVITSEETEQSIVLFTPDLEKYGEHKMLPKISENETCKKIMELANKYGYKYKDIIIVGDAMPSVAFKIHYEGKKAGK